MDRTRSREVLVGIVMIAAGLFYLYLTMNLPRRAFVDAAFVPYVLAIGMCGLGVLQCLSLRRGAGADAGHVDASADADGEAPAGDVDYLTVIKTLALIVAYTALLDSVGFPIVTAVYLFLQFIVLTPQHQRVNYSLYAVIAIVSAAVIFATFRYGFDLLLPAGVLAGVLG